MVGATQDQHLFRGRSPREYFVHTVQRQTNIVLGDQKKRGNVTSPREGKFCANDPRSWVGVAAGSERYYSAYARLDVRRGEYRPTSQTVSHDSNPARIHVRLRRQHMIA